MRKGKAVGVDADLEVRIAQIEQMTFRSECFSPGS
jgi:hypothetical protein